MFSGKIKGTVNIVENRSLEVERAKSIQEIITDQDSAKEWIELD